MWLGGKIDGEEGEAWGLVKKVDSLVCPAFGLFSNSFSLSFFFCFLEEPQDSVSAVRLHLRDVEEKKGQGSEETSGGS